jgi:O-antigen ligase
MKTWKQILAVSLLFLSAAFSHAKNSSSVIMDFNTGVWIICVLLLIWATVHGMPDPKE